MKKDGGKKRVKNKNIFSSKNLLIGFVAIVILLLLFNYTYTFSKRNLDIFRDSELGELYQSVGSGSNVYESCNENTFTMINAFEADSVEDFLEEALRTYKDENKPISDETSADMQDKNELEDFKDILNKILTDAGNGDRTILERDEMQKLLEAYSMYQPPEGEGDPVLDTQKPYVEAWYVEYDPEGSPTTVERIPLDEDAKFPFHTGVNQDIGVIIPTGGGMYSVYKLDWKSAFEPPFLGRTLTDYYPKWKLNGIYPGTFSKEQAVFNLEKPINAANAKVFQLQLMMYTLGWAAGGVAFGTVGAAFNTIPLVQGMENFQQGEYGWGTYNTANGLIALTPYKYAPTTVRLGNAVLSAVDEGIAAYGIYKDGKIDASDIAFAVTGAAGGFQVSAGKPSSKNTENLKCKSAKCGAAADVSDDVFDIAKKRERSFTEGFYEFTKADKDRYWPLIDELEDASRKLGTDHPEEAVQLFRNKRGITYELDENHRLVNAEITVTHNGEEVRFLKFISEDEVIYLYDPIIMTDDAVGGILTFNSQNPADYPLDYWVSRAMDGVYGNKFSQIAMPPTGKRSISLPADIIYIDIDGRPVSLTSGYYTNYLPGEVAVLRSLAKDYATRNVRLHIESLGNIQRSTSASNPYIFKNPTMIQDFKNYFGMKLMTPPEDSPLKKIDSMVFFVNNNPELVTRGYIQQLKSTSTEQEQYLIDTFLDGFYEEMRQGYCDPNIYPKIEDLPNW